METFLKKLLKIKLLKVAVITLSTNSFLFRKLKEITSRGDEMASNIERVYIMNAVVPKENLKKIWNQVWIHMF